MSPLIRMSFLLLAGFAAQGRAEPADKQGFVLLRITMNAQVVNQDATALDYVEIMSAGGERVQLNALRDRDGTRSFGGWVNPGSWSVARLGAVGSPGVVQTTVTIPAEKALPAFTAEQGALTDLGTLVYQPMNQGAATVFRDVSVLDGPAVFRRDAPWLAEQVFKKTLGWPEPSQAEAALRSAKVEAALRGLARRVAGQFNGTHATADGRLYVASSLGQVWVRDGSGTWRTLDTHCVCEIWSVTADGDVLYAGSEYGTLFRSEDAGATFTEVAREPGGRGIVYLGKLRTGEWLVGARSIADPVRQKLSMFDGLIRPVMDRAYYVLEDISQLGTSKPMLALQTEQPGTLGVSGAQSKPPDVAPTPDGFLVFEPPQKLHRYTSATRSWVSTKGPGKSERMFANQNGSVLLFEDAALRSRDHAATWQPIKQYMLNRYRIALFEDGTGFQILRKNPHQSPDVFMTRDGGETWRAGSEIAQLHCVAFAADEVQRRVYCMPFGSGAIFSTADAKSWSQEPVAP